MRPVSNLLRKPAPSPFSARPFSTPSGEGRGSDKTVCVVAELDELDLGRVGRAQVVPGVGQGDVLGRRGERPLLGAVVAPDRLDEAQSGRVRGVRVEWQEGAGAFA